MIHAMHYGYTMCTDCFFREYHSVLKECICSSIMLTVGQLIIMLNVYLHNVLLPCLVAGYLINNKTLFTLMMK